MKIFALLLTFSLSASAFDIPKASFDALEFSNASKFSDSDTNYDFEGIVSFGGCSGSLIRFSGQPLSSKALVLTNGHCYEMIKPGNIISNKPATISMSIFDSQMNAFRFTSTRVVYATMTDTDITILELSESYQDIQDKYNIQSFDLDTIRPSIGTDIEIVSGGWKRGFSCAIDAFIFNLKEGDFLFKDSIRYTKKGCLTGGGTSGSPIISKGTRSVIAIHNTANDNGKRCTLNNPCEVSKKGSIRFSKGRRYGQQTYNIYSCLSPDFDIDLSRPGCALPKPKKINRY